MSLQTATQPVILLGMHRSGTAMIARLLDHLGLFQGSELQEDHESIWFLDINDLLMKRVNASWDWPGPLKQFLADERGFDLTLKCLEEDFNSRMTKSFLGMRRGFEYGSILKYNRPWGWKDPRSIFTLPLWLKLFPGATLVYIVRNGLDVAKSLRFREQRELERRVKEFDGKHAVADRSKLSRAGFKGSSRCLTIEGSFALWEEYVTEAERLLASYSNPRIVIQYESFLANAPAQLPGLAKHCGLNASESEIAEAITAVRVDPARANAFTADPTVADFFESVRNSRWMKHYGYDK